MIALREEDKSKLFNVYKGIRKCPAEYAVWNSTGILLALGK